MRRFAEGWVDRGGASLHYLEWEPVSAGDPGAPILLLHGLSSNAWYWARVVEQLPGRRIVAMDQRGHGATGARVVGGVPAGGLAMPELVADARFVATELELDRPLIAGHSWGATVALEVAASNGAFVSGLVFIDGPVRSPGRMLSWAEAQQFMQPPLPRYVSMDEAYADSARDFAGAWGSDLEDFVRARVMPDGQAWVLTLTAPVRLELLRGLFDSDPDSLWPRLEVPALVMVAMQKPARIAQSMNDGLSLLRDSAPHVQVKTFDSRHDIPLYQPVEVAKLIDKMAVTPSSAHPPERRSKNARSTPL